MVRWGMVIDLDKCTACQACTFACLAENNLPVVGPSEAAKHRVHSWHEFLEMEANGVKLLVPRPCMHCDNAPCVKVCPTGARFYFEGRIVTQSYDRCIGCRMCMAACPYNANYFIWLNPEDGGSEQEHRNPDKVMLSGMGRIGPSEGLLGVVEKCTFCVHKLFKLKQDLEAATAGELSNQLKMTGASWEMVAKAVDMIMRYVVKPSEAGFTLSARELWYLPACVSTCAARARVFGDLDDPSSLVYNWGKRSRAFKLLEDKGTSPKVIYLSQG